MTVLIIGRAVQGLGGGGLMILSQAIIADVVPARQRGKYMGVMGGVFALASVAGPLLGGFFTEGIGWRWAFWMNLPLGALAIVAAVFSLHLPRHDRERPEHRRRRHHAAGRRLRGAGAHLGVGRHDVRLDLAGHPRPHRPHPRRRGRLRVRREPRRRAGHAAAHVPRAQLRPRHRRGPHHRRRDVRGAGLHADLPADGHRLRRHQGRPADDPDDGRPAGHLDGLRADGQPHRSLQGAADRRHPRHRPRARPAVDDDAPAPRSWSPAPTSR